MLVDNKFLYLSIPRTGTSSFQVSCITQGIDLKWVSKQLTNLSKDVSIMEHNKRIPHIHEPLHILKQEFGDKFPIVGVKRNRHEQFLSLWGHVLSIIKTDYSEKIYNRLSTLTSKDILTFSSENVSNVDKVNQLLIDFLNTYNINPNIKKNSSNYRYSDKVTIVDLFRVLFLPSSTWHNHDPSIIWFDFNNLGELEEWTSMILNKNFKLVNINSSNHIDNALKYDIEFKQSYNRIYDMYDLYKTSQTLF
jgi:hypothetical protein